MEFFFQAFLPHPNRAVVTLLPTSTKTRKTPFLSLSLSLSLPIALQVSFSHIYFTQKKQPFTSYTLVISILSPFSPPPPLNLLQSLQLLPSSNLQIHPNLPKSLFLPSTIPKPKPKPSCCYIALQQRRGEGERSRK